MRDLTQGTAFANVDKSQDPNAFVEYLDTVAAMEAAKAYKRRTYELLRLGLGDRVLDVGCGAGDDVRAIADLVGENGRVLGLDASESMVVEARRRHSGDPRIEFTVGDAHRLRLADASFDAGRIDRTLQHLSHPDEAVSELVRVVRSGGRIVASEPDWDTVVVDGADIRTTRVILRVLSDTHVTPLIGRQLWSVLRAHGLLELSVTGFTGTAIEVAFADSIFGLAAAAMTAQEQGAITADEQARWTSDLADASRDGRFFAAITVFVVAGTKP